MATLDELDEKYFQPLDVMTPIVDQRGFPSRQFAQAQQSFKRKLIAETNESRAAFNEEVTLRTTADLAMASQINDLSAEVGDNSAALQEEIDLRVDGDAALASSISSLSATVGTVSSNLTTETSLRVSGDAALASSITTLTANYNDVSATGRISWNVAAGPAGYTSSFGIEAKITGGVDRLAGLYIDVNASLARVRVVADQFVVQSTGGTIIAMFQASGQLTTAIIPSITATMIASNTITANEIAAGAITVSEMAANSVGTTQLTAGAVTATKINVSTLSAITANMGTITAGTLTAGTSYLGIVNASQINASTLAAISANLGTVTAGSITGVTITGSTIRTATSGIRMELDAISATLQTWDVSGNNQVLLAATGLNAAVFLNSANSFAVQATATLTSANAHGIRGRNTASGGGHGIVGLSSGGGGWAFFSQSGGYGPFTGAHDAMFAKEDELQPGDIVIDAGVLCRGGIDDTLTRVVRSSAQGQKAAAGVVSRRAPFEPESPISALPPLEEGGAVSVLRTFLAEHYDRLAVNGVGEGQVRVCGRGGDIEAGDLIITSSMAGCGEKQADDIVRSITVAKARENVTFSGPDDHRLVACIYLCG